MSSEIHLAFAHPEERAEASASSGPCDRISVRDWHVEADIGAFETERGQSQRLRFNVVVEVGPPARPSDDDVDRILSYDRITEAISDVLAAERLNLLETLAERVAERILAEPRAMRTFVRIEKLDRGPGALGVEIVRARPAMPLRTQEGGADQAVHPLIVYLDNAMIDAPDLSARLDALEARGAPVVLCVGTPPSEPPRVARQAVQRRIDLLAIEQNAWRLAARDRRCVVTASRTEIDWAIRHGQTIVWAPSKLVLDTPDGPLDTHDGTALALWLAEVLSAERLVVPSGTDLPVGSPVAVEHAPVRGQ